MISDPEDLIVFGLNVAEVKLKGRVLFQGGGCNLLRGCTQRVRLVTGWQQPGWVVKLVPKPWQAH